MGFSRQEYWSGLPLPSPGNLPNLGIEPGSPTLQADSLSLSSYTQLFALKKKTQCRIFCIIRSKITFLSYLPYSVLNFCMSNFCVHYYFWLFHFTSWFINKSLGKESDSDFFATVRNALMDIFKHIYFLHIKDDFLRIISWAWNYLVEDMPVFKVLINYHLIAFQKSCLYSYHEGVRTLFSLHFYHFFLSLCWSNEWKTMISLLFQFCCYLLGLSVFLCIESTPVYSKIILTLLIFPLLVFSLKICEWLYTNICLLCIYLNMFL